jgi:hypothetical protein
LLSCRYGHSRRQLGWSRGIGCAHRPVRNRQDRFEGRSALGCREARRSGLREVSCRLQI